jgi:hypothetical protein
MVTVARGILRGLSGRVSFPFRGERLTEGLARAGEERPGGDVAHAKGGRELETRHVVQLGEEQRSTLSFGDPGERPL